VNERHNAAMTAVRVKRTGSFLMDIWTQPP
jgi:hypothetical protein